VSSPPRARSFALDEKAPPDFLLACSTAQRDQAGNHSRTNTYAQKAADAQAASQRNATHSPTTTS
jgi:hypothetical protein